MLKSVQCVSNLPTLTQAVRSRTSAQTQQSHFEEEKERLQREHTSSRHRIESLNSQLDTAIQDRDAFELEASKAKRELALVQEERSVLQVQSCTPFILQLPLLICIERDAAQLNLPYANAHCTFIHHNDNSMLLLTTSRGPF